METQTMNVVMPQMGESITEATIMKWHKEVGDPVEEGETLLDISTAKVEVEIPSPQTGVVAEILYPADETVPIDTVIARLAPPGTDVKKLKTQTPAGKEQKKGDEGVEEEEPAHAADQGNGSRAEAASAQETEEDIERERQHLVKRRSTPLVRRLAAELDVDLTDVPGTGIHNRVTKKDLEKYIEEQKSLPESGYRASESQGSKAGEGSRPGAIRMDTVSGPEDQAPNFPGEEVPVTQMRKLIAERMVASKQSIPHAYTVHQIDFTRLEHLRRRQKPIFEEQFNTKLTPLIFLTKAVCETLMTHPLLNASWKGDKIILHRHVNIGVAVALKNGLIVPVLRHVETMSLAGVARAIHELAQRARSNRLHPSEVEGGTFTITSPGQLGSQIATPIINQPQSAILHFGAIHKVPAVVSGPDGEESIAIRSKGYLTLGIDHRVIDGWEADKFMADLKGKLERADFGLAY